MVDSVVYGEKLWRKLVLERDNHTCRECPTRDGLHVHHIKQVALFPELQNDMSNAITLCESCHGKRKQWRGAPGSRADQHKITGEIWRAVVGHEGKYSVSNLGRVRRDGAYHATHSGLIMKLALSRRGYMRVQVARGKLQAVHIIVAAAFIGPRPEGMVINHIDSNPTNNAVDNLEYTTQSENVLQAVKLGRCVNGRRTHPERQSRGNAHYSRTNPEKLARGIHQGSAKLTEDDVRAIRASVGKQRDLARIYGVSQSQIWCVRHRKTWPHIP